MRLKSASIINYFLLTEAPCSYGEIRLIGSEQEGKIELCYEGAWTPVSRLDKTAASMACKQLGFLDYPG